MITFDEDGKTIMPIESGDRDWALFFIFGFAELDIDGESAEGWDSHVDWLAARFATPDDWLGAEGDGFRENCGGNVSREFVARWHRFKMAHTTDTLDDINRQLALFGRLTVYDD